MLFRSGISAVRVESRRPTTLRYVISPLNGIPSLSEVITPRSKYSWIRQDYGGIRRAENSAVRFLHLKYLGQTAQICAKLKIERGEQKTAPGVISAEDRIGPTSQRNHHMIPSNTTHEVLQKTQQYPLTNRAQGHNILE